MLLTEPHCRGFDLGNTQTVREWIRAQDAAVYNDINDKLMEIISLKNRLRPGRLDDQSNDLFYTALYDLDNFRREIMDQGLLQTFKPGDVSLNAALKDDVALLTLGVQWVNHVLFRA